MLEAALVVARVGDHAEPREPSPPSLRRFLGFRRFPPRALAAARRTLDDDESFRLRVRAAVDEAAVGEAGLVFLDRPDGWRDRLAELRGRYDGEDREAELRRARRDLDLARQALVRAEAAAAEAVRAADAARRALDDERAARRAAEAAVTEAATRAAAAEDARRTALANRRDLEALHGQRMAELRAARLRSERLEAELAVARERARPAIDDDIGDDEVPAPEPTASPDASVEGVTPTDQAALAAAVAAAAEAAADLAAALARTAALVGPVDGGVRPDEPAADRATRPAVRRRRSPAKLPMGMLDDGPEAVDHLLRVPGTVVLVDGYNVSIGRWSELRLDQQRARLVDLLGGVQARTGAEVVVVFDGADVGHRGRSNPGRGAQVRFTPDGVEADDVILAMIDQYPADRPVLVVSDDRRVRDGARDRGARVVPVERLLDAAR